MIIFINRENKRNPGCVWDSEKAINRYHVIDIDTVYFVFRTLQVIGHQSPTLGKELSGEIYISFSVTFKVLKLQKVYFTSFKTTWYYRQP